MIENYSINIRKDLFLIKKGIIRIAVVLSEALRKIISLVREKGIWQLFVILYSKVQQYLSHIIQIAGYSLMNKNTKLRVYKVNLHSDTDYVPLLKAPPLKAKPVRLICFYLPQYHEIPENNAWWGVGFTEWTYVRSAEPQFEGHYQPHLPGELGYYNLLDPEVQKRQVDLAKLYGIEGFCFYFYWFGGKRLLEQPLINYLENRNLDLPFCLCWANENWTRRWDGLEKDILIAQQHSLQDDLDFIEHVSRYFKDSRYIRINDKPLLVIYRPSLLPDPFKAAERWRNWCQQNGIGEIHLAYTQSFKTAKPSKYGFDSAIEFPPNNSFITKITSKVKPLNKNFACTVYDWRDFVRRSRKYRKTDYILHRGVCPSWDNTPRRKNRSNILLFNTPQGYQEWLGNAIDETVNRIENQEERLIFINAWNEWAEGNYLEPDQLQGYAYLEATRMALVRKTLNRQEPFKEERKELAIIIHAFYEDIFDEILIYLNRIESLQLKLYITTPSEKHRLIKELLKRSIHPYHLTAVNNRGRDILPFLKILPRVLDNQHRYLVKIHTKKSPNRQDGDIWRHDVFDKILTEKALHESLNYMENNPHIGILGPTGHILPMSFYWGSNASKVESIAARLGVSRENLRGINFVGGSMFIARLESVEQLLNIAIGEEDFEAENMQVDGTMAHAVERLFSVSAYAKGLVTTCLSGSVNYKYKHVRAEN